jgi:hypothetical protein
MRCRKNYLDLNNVERERFVQALYHLKSTGVIDQFANEHETFFGAGIHGTSHFLPWHRDFLWRFEDALRTYHPDISIPYWNSTVDTSTNGPLWADNFLGPFDEDWGLNRALGADDLPTPQQVQDTLDLNTYDRFRVDLEVIIHNAPHRWVEGVMADLGSPGDPVFYLHHCWIDLLWAQWQLLHPGASFVSSGAGFGLNDPMQSVATTPADVLDHRIINLYQYPAGFIQDQPEVSLDTPTVNFIDVPESETRLGAAVFSFNACEPAHFTVIDGPNEDGKAVSETFGLMVSPVTADPMLDTKARVWFSYLGLNEGDSPTGNATIRCDETGEEFLVNLSGNTISRPSAAVVMVLDQSNSMNYDSGIAPDITREDVLKFSAPTAVDVIEDEHAMAVCSFDQDAHPGIGMTSAAGTGKFNINGAIASYSANEDGWTSIGEGVAFAHGILDPVTGYDVKAMIVLTDGEEDHGPHTRRYISDVSDLVTSLNGHIYAIGLGRAEVINPAALQTLCNGNRGYMVMTGDLSPDAYFRLAKYYQQILAGVTNNQIVLDPEGFIRPGQEHRIPFWLNETDITAKAILLSPAPYAISWELESPNGEIINPAVAGAHPVASFEMRNQVAHYKVGLPIPLGKFEEQAGQWHAIIRVDSKNYRKYLAALDNYPKMHARAVAHGIHYSFNVHAYSNLRMKAMIIQNSNEPGAEMTVRAILTEYGVPVAARANCRAELKRPDNTETILSMAEIEPGIFEATVNANLPGIYYFRIVARGRTFRSRRFTREQSLTGAVWKGGDNPPPSSKDDPNKQNDRFCKLMGCLLEVKGIQGALKRSEIDLDELKKCLEIYCAKYSPGKPIPGAKLRLADRLGAIIKNPDMLKAVLQEVDKDCS